MSPEPESWPRTIDRPLLACSAATLPSPHSPAYLGGRHHPEGGDLRLGARVARVVRGCGRTARVARAWRGRRPRGATRARARTHAPDARARTHACVPARPRPYRRAGRGRAGSRCWSPAAAAGSPSASRCPAATGARGCAGGCGTSPPGTGPAGAGSGRSGGTGEAAVEPGAPPALVRAHPSQPPAHLPHPIPIRGQHLICACCVPGLGTQRHQDRARPHPLGGQGRGNSQQIHKKMHLSQSKGKRLF